MDRVSASKRSEIMRNVKCKNTTPEMTVRRLIYAMGYRYRLHQKNLPGTPDLVFKGRKKVIFIHGCFWHGHHCKKGKLPKTNIVYWENKIKKNIERDKTNYDKLKKLNWEILVIWACEIRNIDNLTIKIDYFLNNKRGNYEKK